MNKILVEISVGELLDKISILEIKKEKIKSEEKLKFINEEYNALKVNFDKNINSNESLNNLYKKLKDINSKLWVIEDEKRKCEKNSDFGENFIQLSRNVYINNDKRAKIKSDINKLLGSNGWLARNVVKDASDIIVYFSGHGIANQKGQVDYDMNQLRHLKIF